MESQGKDRDRSKRQGSGTVLTILLFVIGVGSYFAIPALQTFFTRVLAGPVGLLYLLIAAAVIAGWFWFIGYRGKPLAIAMSILVFVFFCIWMAINFETVWDAMVATIGLWPTIIFGLVLAFGIWVVIYMFL